MRTILCLAWLLIAGTLRAQELTGAELYRDGCVPCHGATGEGLSPDHPNYGSFQPPPASLQDPLFNSREPAADWFLVIKYGGPALGLSSQMPAYGDVYSDAQIEAVVEFIKGLVDTSAYPPGDLNFARPVRTIKPFPEDEALFLQRYEDRSGGADALRNTLYYAQRLGSRWQYEIKASSTDLLGESGSEEEVELGLKWAFFDDLEQQLLLGGGLEVEIPLESGAHEVLVPYLGLSKGLGEWTLQANLRAELPTDDLALGAAELSAVGHWMWSPWPRRAFPGLEAILSQDFGSGAEIESSLLPQMLVGLTRGGHVALAVGVEVPLDDRVWDYRVHTFLLWDWADGSFFKGW